MMTDDTISTVQAGIQLGITRQWVRKLVKLGKLEAVRIGRDWRVSKASVEQYAAAHPPRKGESQ